MTSGLGSFPEDDPRPGAFHRRPGDLVDTPFGLGRVIVPSEKMMAREHRADDVPVRIECDGLIQLWIGRNKVKAHDKKTRRNR